MWDFRERDRGDEGLQDTVFFALGAVAGFAAGVILSGTSGPDRVRSLGSDIRRRARSVATSLRPGRLRRLASEQSELAGLEDAVLETFLADEVLSERGIDVGAISPGIVELSGSVWTDVEADRAVEVARAVAGVETVVNRMDVERARSRRDLLHDREAARSEHQWQGRNSGMGRRRQTPETEPGRPDDAQHIRERALADADRDQFREEDYGERPRLAARAEERRDEGNERPGLLDADAAEDPRRFNSDARVGEGPKPGTELRLESSDVPVKPHAAGGSGEGGAPDQG